jgi:hypothetical protein
LGCGFEGFAVLLGDAEVGEEGVEAIAGAVASVSSSAGERVV